MDENLIIRKVYIDSRFRQEGGHQNPTFDLAQNIRCPLDCVVSLDDVTIPHSWYSVSNNNRYLYIAERAGTNAPYTYTIRRLDIPQRNYDGNSYATNLKTALNTNTPANISATYAVVYSPETNKCTIASPATSVFHFLTDQDLQANDGAHLSIDKHTPLSGNRVIRNEDGVNGTNATQYTYTDVFTTGFLDFLGIHNVYIYSNLSLLNSLGPNNQTGILGKVPVSASYGSTIHERLQNEHDYCDVSQTSLSQLQFSIRDAYGALVDLNGASWSATLIFRIK